MSMLPPPLERLIAELTKLPGVGRKTAQRLAFHLLKAPSGDARALAEALTEVREKTRLCSICFNLTDVETCALCSDPRRDSATVCVVEEASDAAALERAGVFRGVYHVLGGALSPLRDVGPEDLRIRELLVRLNAGAIREVVLALGPDVEGEATAVYLGRLIKPLGITITRIAQGLPAGADLEFTDDLTLQRAFEGRRDW
jgi:recombination protein RecR